MSFANPSALWFLLFTVIASAGAYAYSLYLQKRLSRWVDFKFWPTVIPEYSKSIFVRKNITLGISLLFLVLALARPQWGEHEEFIQSEGMDILVLLDLSNSMSAEDTPPSRLNRAQTFIKKMLQNLADDRVGVVAFAGKAFLTVPLTTDFGYVSEMVDTLDPGAMASQGTNIGAAIDVGMKAFERGGEDDHKTSRAMILISDGEDFGEDAFKEAKKLVDFGTGFFTLSVGTSEGAPIPIRNESGILQTYKKDLSGKPVLTRVNRELLAKVAAAGNGTALELINPDDAAYAITKQLKSYTRGSKKEQRQVTKIDRFQYFLAIAILFLFLNLFTGYSRLGYLLLFFCISTISEAQTLDSYLKSRKAEKQYGSQDFEGSAKTYEDSRLTDPDNSILQYNEATALAKGKKNEDAIFNFNQATKKSLSQGDYETAAKSLYNEGITQAEQKNLKDSYDRLTKAIELSKISNQPEVEKKAREALMTLIQKQKEQSKKEESEKKDEKDEKNDPQSKGQGKPEPKPGDEKKSDKTEEGKRREFKSGTLSKDVAESVMNDLADREKQLYQKRMKERKTREVPNDKDW